MTDPVKEDTVTCVKGPSGGPWSRATENETAAVNNEVPVGGKRKSKKSSKKGTKKTRKNKKSNKKGKKTQKGGSSLSHSDVNSSQSIATSVDNKLSLAGSIESGLFPGVQKITGGMNMGGMNMGTTPTPKSMMGGANTQHQNP